MVYDRRMDEQKPATTIIFASKARKRLLKGIRKAAAVVGCTLGPKGKTVLIQNPGQMPIVSKDGVTVSRSIRLADPVERMGADLIREAASQTNDTAGDGTTTATVLTAALIEEGLRLVEAGLPAREVCAGIERGARIVDDALTRGAKVLITDGEIEQAATVSANGDAELGRLIAGAMSRVGRDGIITVEDAKGTTTTVEIAEGMRFDRGYLSPYFVTDQERMRVVMDGAQVLVTDRKLVSLKELIPILEQVARAQRALLIIADDVEGDALQGLVLNKVKGVINAVAVKAPGFGPHRGELLGDVCALTGATLVSAATGLTLDRVTSQELGGCKRVVVDARSTTIVANASTKPAVDARVAELRTQLEDVTLSTEDRDRLRGRIARLAAGAAVVRVGGATEIEMCERKFRVEDALNATKAAVEEGIVPGGGSALYACGRALLETQEDENTSRDEVAGVEALARACFAPMRKIVENAGQDFGRVANELTHRGLMSVDQVLGYNAATGQYEDLTVAGIVDPCKVTRTALKNAVSVAVTFLSLDAVIFEDRDEKSPDQVE